MTHLTISPTNLTVQRDSWAHLTLLHLLPGLLALLVYILLAQPIEQAGFPSMMAWLVTVALVNLPFELAVLFRASQRRKEGWSLKGVLPYDRPLSLKSFSLWFIGTFGAVLLLYVLSGPISQTIEQALFFWLPAWFKLDTGLEGGGFSRMALLILNLASIPVFVIAIPVVEEWYFRGYLLPRLAHLGWWAVVVNSVLFALYHFTTPWLLVTRTLITLPLAFAAYRLQNLKIPIVIHVIANSVEVILGFIYLAQMA